MRPPFAAFPDAMRTFLRAHWKVIVAIVLLIVLAMITVNPSSAMPEPALAARLRAHAALLASQARPEQTASYIEDTLRTEGYRLQRQAHGAGGRQVGNIVSDIEVSVANVAPGGTPERIFIVGAHYASAPDAGYSGTSAVLELARLLKDLRPTRGTEVKFVFFADAESPGSMTGGSFIAYVGTLASSRPVQEALSAFQGDTDLPAYGLAAPAYVQGITLSGRTSHERSGAPAVMVTDTAFMRYPYHHTGEETPDKEDYTGVARVVQGLARTITALAAGQRG
jgi:hypothetical protein